MSAHRRNNLTTSSSSSAPPSLSGTEMLVLQQSIKQYILTRQQQQQRPTGRSTTTKTPVLYPTTSSGRPVSLTTQKHPPTPAPLSTASNHPVPAVVASKPARQPLGNRAIAQNTNSTLLQPTTSTTTTAAPNTSRTSLVPTKAGPKTDKKRAKGFTVYQDKENENAPSKRRRIKGQVGNESDSDKENRDPLVAIAAANAIPRKSNVLGEKTNFINSVLNTNAGITKGKEALRNIVASKIVDMAATAPLAIPKTTRTTQQKQEQQKQQQHQTRLYPSSTPAATTAPVASVEQPATGKQSARQRRIIQDDESPFVESQSKELVVEESNTKDVPAQPDQGASHDHLLLNVKEEPVDVVKLEPATAVEWPVEARSLVQQEIVRVPETPPRKSVRIPETPPRSTVDTSQQIPGSVEDEGSTSSYERYVKLEHADKTLAPRKPTIDYYEIPCSEASQDSIGSASLEETCPMPEFLLEELPEDRQHDEAEVTLVDAVNPKQLNRRVSAAASASPAGSVSQSSRRNSTLESTTFADGLWCIEDMRHCVVETVCGFQEQWLAMETTSHVQFWKLDNDTPSVKSQWVRYINLSKTSSRPTQVLFAPDDSFAVVMDAPERSFTKVPLRDLDYLQQNDFSFPTYSWTGLKPLSGCKGFIVEQDSDDGHLVVVAAEEAGCIGFISVPSNDGENDGCEMLQAKSVTVPGIEEPASSLALVEHTSLVAATFGPTVALWDVNSLVKPVSVVDTSGLLLTNPQLVYASVPVQFFEKEKMLGMDHSLPAAWPVLVVFRESAHSNQCTLYAMKGGHIERIHQYQGSSSITSVCASSRFIACQVKVNGKDVLQLWDISKPEPVIQFSLLEPPSLAEVATQRSIQQQNLWHQQVASASKQEENGVGCSDDLEDLFSSVSTLSPPPEDLSSPPFPSIETEAEAAPLPVPLPEERSPSPVRRRPIVDVDVRQQSQSQSGRVSRPPAEWIDLTSIAIMERKEVSFSIHSSQHWVVVVQKSSMMKSPSVIHILDLMSILYPSSSAPSS
ncbi:hypothetical protein BGZ47_008867 [Haplosporangium gracile]|nr:hypothetical protein BGZ47_008867 [Haplosporangium gracile]